MGFVQRRLVKFVMRVVSYPKVTVAICAVLLVAAVVYAWFGLKLSTDQDELMAPKLQFFRDYKTFAAQFPENDSFVVIVEPRDYAHPPPSRRWIQYADSLSANLEKLTGVVSRVNTKTPPESLGVQGLLFEEWPGIKSASADVREFSRLIRVLVQPSPLERLLGDNLTQRFFNALSNGPAKGSAEFATVITRSLAAALVNEPAQWHRGREIPDLTDADPQAAFDPSRYGYNMLPDETKRPPPPQPEIRTPDWERYHREKILVINVYTDRDFSSLADVTEPLQQMRAAVAKVSADFPEFKPPAITGRPALEADEMATSDRDTRIAEICGLTMVFIVLLFFLRNLWLVIVAELCLGVGIGWTFGWATLVVGRLNILSLVFVIALIGIGMDYLIQILTRYRYEKRRYARPQAIWARVFRYVSPPISTACAGAAGAFLVSVLTDFRGAAELGIIAGSGLLLCLATGYTLMPALLTLFPASVGAVHVSRRYRHRSHGGKTVHPRAGGVRLLPMVAWILVSIGGLFLALPPRFDANLLKLQADGLPSVRNVRKLPAWYAVALSQDLDTLRAARAALATNIDSTIRTTESVLDAIDKRDWLIANNADLNTIQWPAEPPAAPTVAQLLSISDAAETMLTNWSRQNDAGDLAPIRAAVADLRAVLANPDIDQPTKIARTAAWQTAFVRELHANIAQFTPPPLNVRALPEDLRNHLAYFPKDPKQPPIYALYIYPRADLWDSDALADFVREVELRTPTNVTLTGIAPQLFHSTLEIHHAFMVSTLYALVLIIALVLLDLRNLFQTILAISVLAFGLPMLLLMMWVWHERLHDPFGIPGTWNFANFFALPILIGAGHEYGVFLVHRYRETLHDPRRIWRVWDVSDRALLLCGIVTSASFGFLIAAQHHGLASLGWVMCVGTACIYLASLFVLRPILQWRIKHKGIYYKLDRPPRPQK